MHIVKGFFTSLILDVELNELMNDLIPGSVKYTLMCINLTRVVYSLGSHNTYIYIVVYIMINYYM